MVTLKSEYRSRHLRGQSMQRRLEGDSVSVGLTEANISFKTRSALVELRVGEGKDVRIAWLLPGVARRLAYGLLLTAAKAQAGRGRT